LPSLQLRDDQLGGASLGEPKSVDGRYRRAN
jgi:hypothetical protein